MSGMVLKSFQPTTRIAQLQREGILVGDWFYVLPGTERAYGRMVEMMTERGIDCHGKPPIWAWHGDVRLRDAIMLLDPEHELSRGYGTVTFIAPTGQAMVSDYRQWCDALFRNADVWDPAPPVHGPHPAQATLPHLRADWVLSIDLLPVDGWNDLDLERPL